MLTKTGPNAVQSSEGFRVAIIKRFELQYEDQSGKMTVPIEPMADGELVVGKSAIGADRRELLSKRISDALSFLEIAHSFE